MRVLIVGAGSVSGGAAVDAAESLGAEIITTTSRDTDLPRCSHTIHGIDLEDPRAVDKILADSELCRAPVDYILYIPARGAVGMTVEEAVPDMIEPSLAYSVRPYLRLHEVLEPKKTVALSGFITMPPLMKIYGAMTFTKIAMEQLAVRYPKSLQVIRIGMFHSNSVRGIMILAQRRFMRDPDYQPEWRAEWKASGRKFTDYFYAKNYSCEEETHRSHSGGVPFRPTEPKDITNGFKLALNGEEKPIINVLGPWLWTEDVVPPFPESIASRIGLIPSDLVLQEQPR
ncbi:MAG: hypothetical protein HY042_06330 [Spirochaetia bacterium]|nr:hypothetical protein [Spirochaetia bacterium]